MKNLLLIVVFVVLDISLKAQVVKLSEGFENLPISFTSTGTVNWARSSVLQSSGTYSDTVHIANSLDTARLTSVSFSTIGMPFVFLSFDQICKLPWGNNGIIEVSADSGNTWVRLTGAYYNGSGHFANIGNRFTSASYDNWDAINNTSIPQNSWWHSEDFNISFIAGNSSNVMIRFTVQADIMGGMGSYGWLLDNIEVVASVYELIPPNVSVIPPLVMDTVNHNGPYDIYAEMWDSSGIDTAYIVYTSNSIVDTIGMDIISISANNTQSRKASIPSHAFGASFCYKVVAIDASGSSNISQFPNTGCENVYIERALVDINIGYGANEGYIAPIYNDSINGSKKYSEHISLIKVQEMGFLEGDIVKLAWNKVNSTAYTNNNAQLKIYLKHSASDTVSSLPGSFATTKQGATLVYNSTNLSIGSPVNWIDFQFNIDSFYYDGIQNLLILAEWYRPDSLTQDQMKWQYTTTIGRAVTFVGNSASPSAVYGLGQLPNTTLYIVPKIYNLDIGVSKIVEPQSLVVGLNSHPIKVRVKNYGKDTINKLSIHYSVDGQLDSAYLWTGQLFPDLVTNNITLANEVWTTGSHSITSWTSLPNDSTDEFIVNDSITQDFYVCNQQLSGSYTVGGSNADFQSLHEVEGVLNHCGIVSSVVFYINSGNYTDHIRIGNISGISSQNTITFTSSTGNADNVKISYNAQSLDKDYVFMLDSASWITIKNLSLESTGQNHSTAILVKDSSQNNVVEHCKLISGSTTNSYSYGIHLIGENTSFNRFSNNKFVGNDYGISLNGGTNYCDSNIVDSNIFKLSARTAIKANKQTKLYVANNKISTNPSSTYLVGIDIQNCGLEMEIVNNNIDMMSASYIKGLKVSTSNGSNNAHNLIANNFVIVRGSSVNNQCIGFELVQSSYTNVYNNSFSMNAGGITSRAIYINAYTSSSASNINLVNNIFSHSKNGICIEVSNGAISNSTVANSDYNAYYSNGAIFAKWGYSNSVSSSLGAAGLTAINQMDSNSVFTNPLFYSHNNLHSFSSVINGAATVLSSVTKDIDGDIRSLTTPDIGADEFTLSTTDAGIIGLIEPLALDTQGRSLSPKVIIRNFGSSAITTMSIKYRINGGSLQSYTYTGNLAYSSLDTVALTTMTVPVLNYDLLVYVDLIGDTLNSNDSMSVPLYGMPLIDIKTVSLLSPVDACDMDTNEVVKIKIKNNGLSPISSGLTASYQLVGSATIVTESVTASINPGADIIYTFNTKADLSVGGTDSLFKFKIFTSHAADPIGSNDTTFGNVLSLGILSAPSINDTTINYGASVTLTASSPYNTVWYEQDTSAISIANGPTYTTPPLFDTTTYYVESNTNIPALTKYLGQDVTTNTAGASSCIYRGGGATHQILILASELQNMGLVAGNITSLSFYMVSTTYATNHSQFTIKMGHTNATSLTTSFITSGLTLVYQQSFTEVIGWNTHTFANAFNWDGTSNIVLDFLLFTSYGNPSIRYSATNFNSVAYNVPYGGGTGVSTERPNMRFTTDPVLGCAGTRTPVTVNVPLAAIEANMSAILTPNQSCGLDSTLIECQIVNMGTDTIPGGYSVSYQINNGTFTTPETLNTAIAPGDTLAYTFIALAALPSGPIGTTYSISAAVSTPNDYFASNDTVTLSGIWSEYTPAAPFVAATPTANYGSSVTLVSTSTDSVYWYSDSIATNPIGDGASIQIGPLFDTTMVYAQAQKTVPLSPFTIGNGTTQNTSSSGPSPFGAASYTAWGLRNQFLIRASEMRAMGMLKGEIESLAFNINISSNNTHKDYSIKIGTTNLSELTSFETGLTTIFSALVYTEAIGWNTYTFPTPFYWDGVSNVVIETCFKNTAWVTTGYARGPYTTTSYISSLASYSGSNFSCSDTIQDAAYYKRPNIKFIAKGYGSCPSAITSHQVNIQGAPTVDAGVVSLVIPNGTISSVVAEDIKVVLKNYGLNTLTSVAINWMDRDMTVHTYPWTGQLLSGDTLSVTIASHLFMGGQTRLYSWTSMPNSVIDTILLNDTAFTDLSVCMNGTYSIGVNRNYANLQLAFDDMVVSSMCGPVVFDIDTGVYQNQYILSAIAGSSSTNSITIKSVGNDSSTVQLNSNSTQQNNYVLKLENSQYVTIRDLTIGANGSIYANAIVLDGNTHHINIENNVINSSSTFVGAAVASGVYSNDKLVGYVNINNNIINNGYQSIYFKGVFSTKQKRISITNNIMMGFKSHGVYANYQDSIIIEGNNFTSGLLGLNVYGVQLYNTINYYQINRNNILLTPSSKGQGIFISNAAGTIGNRARIANNMISISIGASDNKGAYLSGITYSDFVYNSINIVSGTNDCIGAHIVNGNYIKFVNNNLYTKKGRIVNVLNPSSITQCDYNNYYTDTITNSLFAKWISDVTSIAALKAIDLSSNTHSLSVDPLYYTNTNLHAREVQLDGAAIPISHTTIDIDSETRNSSNPDIGADEFTVSPIDIGAVYLSNPYTSGCGYTSSDSLVVKIRNYGTSVLNFATLNANIELYSTGVNPDTISYVLNTGTLASGAIMDVKITNTFDLSLVGQYTFDASATIAGDGNSFNNAMPTMQFISYQTISSFPFAEGFESGNNQYFANESGSECYVYVSSASASTGNFGMQYIGGDNTGFTPTLTVDDAFSHADHLARIYSCQIDANNVSALNLQFDLKQIYYNNPYQSWFRVLISDQNGIHYAKNLNGDSTFRPITHFSDPFQTQTFVLSAYVGQVFSIYFEAAVGSGPQYSQLGDNVYVDNISIWEPVSTDIALQGIYSFSKGYDKTASLHIPSVVIKNFGADTITSVPIKYNVNGQQFTYDTLSVYLLPLQSDTVNLNSGFALLSGVQQLCIISDVPGDSVAANDTVCDYITGLDLFGLNYTDDFESTDKWFSKGTNMQWELGSPNSANFDTAYSGINVWATILNGNYLTQSEEYLYSPFFQLPTSTDTVTLEFMQQMRVHPQSAYGFVEYSVNGQIWLTLGYISAANSNNWYNANINGKHAWSTQTNSWLSSSIALDPSVFIAGSEVQFRFVFVSIAASSSMDGWMIDDFKLNIPPQQFDVGVQQIVLPDTTTMMGSNITLEVTVHNYGYDTISQIPIAYKLGSANELVEIWNGTLLPDSSFNYVFNTTYSGPLAAYSLCAYTKLANDNNAGNDKKCKPMQVMLPDWDAAVVDVNETYDLAGNIIEIVVTNLGTDTILQLPVSFSVATFVSNMENISVNINPGDTVNYTFGQKAPVLVGTFNLCGMTNLSNDMIPSNDQLCKTTTDIDNKEENKFQLAQNQPNPFTNNTEIVYWIPKSGNVNFMVYNVLGELVFLEEHKNVNNKFSKSYNFTFLNAGIYYYSIEFEGKRLVKKMIVR